MAGTGGIGGGSVKVWIEDSNAGAKSEAKAKGGPNSHGKQRAEASVGDPNAGALTFTFKRPDGSTFGVVTVQPGQEVKFEW